MPDETSDLLVKLNQLWVGQFGTAVSQLRAAVGAESTKIETEWMDDDKIWEVRLVLATDQNNPHGADWAEYTWTFPDDTLVAALTQAVDWCRELDAWREECQGTGLAAGEAG